MSSFVHDPGKWSQGLEELVKKHTQIQSNLSRCRCSKCDLFGVFSGVDDYYDIIYRCSCQPVLWVISPKTGDRIEEVKA